VHPSGRRSYYVRALVRARGELGFPSQTQIWEDNYNRPDDVCSRPDALLHKASLAFNVQPSELQSSWSERSSFIYENLQLKFNRSDAALFGKEFQANLESRSHSCLLGRPQLPSRRRLAKSHQTRFRFLWPINRDP
jgi:hypothetical protein